MNELNEAVSFELMQQRLWADIRAHRNQQLQLADIEVRILEDNGQDATAWRTYRQQLRDLPATVENPTQVSWPKKPA